MEEESAEECISREAKEESGLEVKIRRYGPAFEYLDKYGRAVGLPFLLQSKSRRVRLSEHTEYRWVSLRELKKYDCVPEIGKALVSLKLTRGQS